VSPHRYRMRSGDLFPAKVALCMENAFDAPTFDKGEKGVEPHDDLKKGEWKTLAPDEWKEEMDRKTWLGTFHFNFSLTTMQNICSTHGVICALLLTMNIGSFASMTVEEWEQYEKGIATARCERGGYGVNLNANLTDCARENREITEVWFVLSNHLAASFLLLCLLLATGLYICVSLPNAAESRPDEIAAVVARFSGEFTTLQVLFVLSIFCSGSGLVQLVQLKTSNWEIVIAVNWITAVTGLALAGMGIWLFQEVQMTKKMIKELRSHNSMKNQKQDSVVDLLQNLPRLLWLRRLMPSRRTRNGNQVTDASSTTSGVEHDA